MTNMTRAKGTLKLTNRKLDADNQEAAATKERRLSGPAQGEELKENRGSSKLEDENEDELQLELEELESRDQFELADDELGGAGKLSQQEQRQRRRLRLGGLDEEHLGGSDGDAAANPDRKQPEDFDGAEENARTALEPGEQVESGQAEAKAEFRAELVWRNIVLFVILHSSLPIGAYLIYTQRPWLTLAWSLFGMYASGLGVTGGAHRLWSHKSYKASASVEILLMLLQTMAGQNSIYTWSRDHRVHHKFSETDADPHNIKRGFFFAHMGWLCCRKHPDVREKGHLIDMSDLESNRIVMFQHRHFWWLAILCTVLAPTMVPVLLWNERFWTSFTLSFMVRYLITLHGTWLVNSAAHYFGSRPYDRRIEARESPFVIMTGLGEGFHNYHHTFPFDYSTSEFGKYFNITTAFIDTCARLGLVHDRRKMDRKTIESRQLRTGDKQAE